MSELSFHRSQGWRLRRRPLGDSFVGCLATCVLVIGGLVWGYFHFMQNRNLENPTDGLVFSKTTDNSTVNIYRKRMIREPISRLGPLIKRIYKLYQGVKKGEWSDDDFDQEASEIERGLRDTMNDEIKSRNVPERFRKGHIAVAEAYGFLYTALNKLRDAQTLEGDLRTAPLKEAYKNYKKAKSRHRRAAERYGKV